VRVLACGDAAVLVELEDLDAVLALAAAVRAAALPGVLDVVPAARTVLVTAAPGTDLEGLRRTLRELPVDPVAAAGGPTVEIPVVYDGPDLGEVARLTGLAATEVVAAHTGRPWLVAFGGFAPGFAYLVDGDTRLRVSRRAEPRTRVPAGAVGLADSFSGVYPRSSPGGWQLIGRTDAVLWDVERDPPALLQPGGRVRFVEAAAGDSDRDRTALADEADPEGATAAAGRPGDRAGSHPAAARPPDPAGARRCGTVGARASGGDSVRALEVLATGPLALVQDLGRPGLAASGVGRSGAADRGALRLANRLVANPEGAAGIEVTFAGLVVRARAALTVALAGAPAPAEVDGSPVGHHAVLRLRAGQRLALGPPASGLRTYLAVRGGIAVAPVLGSRSTDVLSGVGPAPLVAGDVLPVGPEPDAFPLVDVAPVAVPPSGTVTLRALPGPRDAWVADLAALTRTTWTASGRSDRVGMRLTGGRLDRSTHAELPSEGAVRGAVQVPPGGEPVLFLADHPVTGGYPVVAVVLDADTDRAAQVRPGQRVRFVLVEP